MSASPMEGFKETTSLRIALTKFLDSVQVNLDTEHINIENSLKRVLAEDISAEYNIPQFNRAAMDGYAIKAEDSRGASFENPIRFKIVGRLEAGFFQNFKIKSFEAVEIMTGARVPDQADCVIMAEYTKRISEDIVEIYQQLPPGANIDQVGSDVKKGETILTKGTIIEPPDIGLLKALRLRTVKVYKKPKVGLISTGDELTDYIELDNGESKIIETNQIMLSNYILEDGGEPLKYGIIRDNFDDIKKSISKAVSECNIILLTGGSSVGKKDLVPKIIREIGIILTHGVSMKPGKPTGLALVQGKPLIIMPGYSVACIIAYLVFCRPLIYKFLSINPELTPISVNAYLTNRVPSTAGRTDFVRVNVFKHGEELYATPIRSTGSGILSSMVKANGLLEIPDEIEGYEEGDKVSVKLLRRQIPEKDINE
ncbi:MAG: molybdopterin molybdotransferase MoeA [Candidatus Odinarchaeum yellowstonii]|uniref:Molybdopterin molybdotransferase MoeA n=1 Tax=Odinarchaeota yellowstonii (strain LCB_4) TaxID=1841599 RepID=A0AAF0IAZ4_ODILC|nr:MAG: molybdopterin molybdotransferase MoeA [Candidatus Odinarchaeum yellowstonii]